MHAKTVIPPVTVPGETLPETLVFRKRPAEAVVVNDLIQMRGKVWRVKHVRRMKHTPRIQLTLWPVQGGRPEVLSSFPREWHLVARGY